MENICRLTGGDPDHPTDAEKFLCRTLAYSRHRWRVQTTLDAAFSLAGNDPAGAFLVLILDMNGIGGPYGAGGDGKRTDRLLVVGSGRWQAGDGYAYHAAALDAMREFGWHAEVKPASEGFIVQVVWDGGIRTSQFDMEWLCDHGLFPWAMSYTRRKLIDGHKSNMDLSGWANLYNQLVQVPASGYLHKYNGLDAALFELELALDPGLRGIQWPDPIRFSRDVAGETQRNHAERLLSYADDEYRRQNYAAVSCAQQVRAILGMADEEPTEEGVIQIK